MKRQLITCVIAIICLTQCQVNSKEQKTTNQPKATIEYDDYSNEKSFSLNNQSYNVNVKVYNIQDSYVEYQNEQFNNREIEIVISQGDRVAYEKKISKNIFNSYYVTNELESRLIYSCSLSEGNDTNCLFIAKINLCEPETDNCRYFNLDFKQDGMFSISEEEVSNKGEN